MRWDEVDNILGTRIRITTKIRLRIEMLKMRMLEVTLGSAGRD